MKRGEFREISHEIERELGPDDELGRLLNENVEEYLRVVDLLAHRGTREFGEISKQLYGSAKDNFYGDDNTIVELGQLLYGILGRVESSGGFRNSFPEELEAEDVVKELNSRFADYFEDDYIRAKIADGIVADAAAGSDVVKIKAGCRFSKRDVDILEVHEGWVHIGTTQNGINQHVAKWLAKGPPRCASTQEGLAVIMEIMTFRTYPKRARTINDRILGIDKVEEGANILELIEFYRTEGYSEEDALTNAKRIFRGAPLTGGAAFTKDLSYCRGFIENYNFMRSATRAGHPYLLPFLFVGKINIDDIPLLYQKYKEGIVDFPKYLPALFKDLSGLVVWMSFSSFLNQVNLRIVQDHYEKQFEKYL